MVVAVAVAAAAPPSLARLLKSRRVTKLAKGSIRAAPPPPPPTAELIMVSGYLYLREELSVLGKIISTLPPPPPRELFLLPSIAS